MVKKRQSLWFKLYQLNFDTKLGCAAFPGNGIFVLIWSNCFVGHVHFLSTGVMIFFGGCDVTLCNSQDTNAPEIIITDFITNPLNELL